MFMHIGDVGFVKLCMRCPLVDFSNSLVDVISRPDTVAFDLAHPSPGIGTLIKVTYKNMNTAGKS